MPIGKLELFEQIKLFQWAAAHAHLLPELSLLYAIPNGGHRHISVAKELKASGVKAGVPDICLPVARAGYNALYLELKAKTGKPSPEQKKWLGDLTLSGNRAVVAVGHQTAIEEILSYLGSDE